MPQFAFAFPGTIMLPQNVITKVFQAEPAKPRRDQITKPNHLGQGCPA